jgi:hypothetical protein
MLYIERERYPPQLVVVAGTEAVRGSGVDLHGRHPRQKLDKLLEPDSVRVYLFHAFV